jgi:hypothetical protein
VGAVIAHLVRVVPIALVVAVLPGYFWAGLVRRTDGLGERLAYSAAISLAAVPTLALALTRVLHSGVTLPIAVAVVVIVAASGALALRIFGSAPGVRGAPALPRPRPVSDSRVLILIIVALGLAVATAAGAALPGWLLLVTAAALVVAGVLSRGGTAAAKPGAGARPGGSAGGPAGPPAAPGSAFSAAPVGPVEPGAIGSLEPAALLNGSAPPLDEPKLDEPAPDETELDEPEAADPGLDQPADGELAAPDPASPDRALRPLIRPALRAPLLVAILALTAIRSYVGIVYHDWPYLRGEDMFSHAVMTEQMMAHGNYASYLVYPPGFATTSAVICRLCGLPPLLMFPVITPALMLLTVLAAYALVTRLWGWDYGLVAAALSGLVLIGPDVSLGGGLYPDLLAAFFFMVMVVTALISLFQAPTIRSGLLVVLMGGTVVLYHSVGTLYLVVLLAGVTLVCLPYLLLRARKPGPAIGRSLIISMAGIGALSLAYAWHIYGLGHVHKAGGTAATVSLDVGSQSVLPAGDLFSWVGAPVIWLGLLGFVALAMTVRRLRQPGQVAAALAILTWGALMYLGSRVAADGFPQRFERDVGAPLTVLAVFAIGMVAQSLLARRVLSRQVLSGERARRAVRALAAPVTAAVIVVLVQVGVNLHTDSQPSREVTPRAVALAGAWLHRHNTGGTVISTPELNRGVTNRAVLAMGFYTGLQSYELPKIIHPRSLPTAGKRPLLDSREVLTHPTACSVPGILRSEHVRYVFLYRKGNEADFAGFRGDPALYRRVFENSDVVIYAPVPGARPAANC